MIRISGPAILDLNTQNDLFAKQGVYTLHNFAAVVPALNAVFQWADKHSVPVVSTRLHSASIADRGKTLVVGTPGTEGHKKLPGTLLRRFVELPVDCGTDIPVQGFAGAQQFIFDLTDTDPFVSPRLDRLLSEAEADIWLVMGGPLELSVRMAVLGLLQRRQKVALIKDGFAERDAYEGEMALRQIESKNIEWLDAAEVPDRFAPKRRVLDPARKLRLGRGGMPVLVHRTMRGSTKYRMPH